MPPRVGIDANVIVSFLLDRNVRQQERAAELFDAAAAGELRVVLHQSVIAEAVYVLKNLYQLRPSHVASILRDLMVLPGVVTTHELDWDMVSSLWPRRMKDFGDACLATVAESGSFDALATFDAAFARRLRRRGLATYW